MKNTIFVTSIDGTKSHEISKKEHEILIHYERQETQFFANKVTDILNDHNSDSEEKIARIELALAQKHRNMKDYLRLILRNQ